jgi:hypothetical protein
MDITTISNFAFPLLLGFNDVGFLEEEFPTGSMHIFTAGKAQLILRQLQRYARKSTKSGVIKLLSIIFNIFKTKTSITNPINGAASNDTRFTTQMALTEYAETSNLSTHLAANSSSRKYLFKYKEPHTTTDNACTKQTPQRSYHLLDSQLNLPRQNASISKHHKLENHNHAIDMFINTKIASIASKKKFVSSFAPQSVKEWRRKGWIELTTTSRLRRNARELPPDAMAALRRTSLRNAIAIAIPTTSLCSLVATPSNLQRSVAPRLFFVQLLTQYRSSAWFRLTFDARPLLVEASSDAGGATTTALLSRRGSVGL